MTARARITKNVNIDSNGCWVWQNVLMPNGYGNISFGNKKYLVHRLSYIEFRGPIPEGMQIDHLCRNRACCNPDHLEAVTQKENLNRGVNWQRSKTHCKHGHEFNLENTRPRSDGGRDCRKCNIIRIKKFMDKRRATNG